MNGLFQRFFNALDSRYEVVSPEVAALQQRLSEVADTPEAKANTPKSAEEVGKRLTALETVIEQAEIYRHVPGVQVFPLIAGVDVGVSPDNDSPIKQSLRDQFDDMRFCERIGMRVGSGDSLSVYKKKLLTGTLTGTVSAADSLKLATNMVAVRMTGADNTHGGTDSLTVDYHSISLDEGTDHQESSETWQGSVDFKLSWSHKNTNAQHSSKLPYSHLIFLSTLDKTSKRDADIAALIGANSNRYLSGTPDTYRNYSLLSAAEDADDATMKFTIVEPPTNGACFLMAVPAGSQEWNTARNELRLRGLRFSL